MSVALITGPECRVCGGVISQTMLAEGRRLYGEPLGNAEKGFICWKCLNDQAEAQHSLAKRLTEFWTIYVDASDVESPPCAICGTLEGEFRRGPLMIDGQLGFICLPCEPVFEAKLHRDYVRGTRWEYDRKFK